MNLSHTETCQMAEDRASVGSGGGNGVMLPDLPAFVSKVWDMVCDPSSDAVISWGAKGDEVIIWDRHVLASSVLPRYFNTRTFESFTRQMNAYGFRRRPSVQKQTIVFTHPDFKLGQKSQLFRIRKKKRRRTPKQQEADMKEVVAKLRMEVNDLQNKFQSIEFTNAKILQILGTMMQRASSNGDRGGSGMPASMAGGMGGGSVNNWFTNAAFGQTGFIRNQIMVENIRRAMAGGRGVSGSGKTSPSFGSLGGGHEPQLVIGWGKANPDGDGKIQKTASLDPTQHMMLLDAAQPVATASPSSFPPGLGVFTTDQNGSGVASSSAVSLGQTLQVDLASNEGPSELNAAAKRPREAWSGTTGEPLSKRVRTESQQKSQPTQNAEDTTASGFLNKSPGLHGQIGFCQLSNGEASPPNLSLDPLTLSPQMRGELRNLQGNMSPIRLMRHISGNSIGSLGSVGTIGKLNSSSLTPGSASPSLMLRGISSGECTPSLQNDPENFSGFFDALNNGAQVNNAEMKEENEEDTQI